MFQKYLNFLRGISVNWFGKIGVVLATSSFITFIILEFARILGIFTNQYMGLITYLTFPTLFLIGLVLIPIGWWRYTKQRGKSTKELLNERFSPDDVVAHQTGSRLFLTVAILTLINVIFMGGASVRGLHFMDTPEFCGTTCHTVMNPEWTTYQDSPHARVKCVECHVGEGVDALIDSKLNGARQMVLAAFDIYSRPIPTPVHRLRPARETCEKCHWPDKFYGSKLKTIIHYDRDSTSTPKYTTLGLKIDTGHPGERAGIHWHIGKENEVRYASVNDERKKMIWVEVRQEDGSFKRYTNQRLHEDAHAEDIRTFDCIDCHNRATHIYEDPETAIDDRIRKGLLDRSLPYLKREALSAITANYPNQAAAMSGIEAHLSGFYQRNYPRIAGQKMAAIDQAITVLQAVYNRNIHHQMQIEWGTYPSHIGHRGTEDGCFRCHNQNLVAEDGSTIAYDCTTCHSILSNEEDSPFKYLETPSETDRNAMMHEYLKNEFMNWY